MYWVLAYSNKLVNKIKLKRLFILNGNTSYDHAHHRPYHIQIRTFLKKGIQIVNISEQSNVGRGLN
jgi:hypothetical protein